MHQAGGQGDINEFLTIAECPVPDMRDTGWQSDGGKFLTIPKCLVPDMCKASWQCYGFNTETKINRRIKGTPSNHLAFLFHLIRFKTTIMTPQQFHAICTIDHSVLVFDPIGNFLIGGFSCVDFDW